MLNTTVNIEGKPGLVRDLSSGAILNTNSVDYENHLLNRTRSARIQEKIVSQQDQINSMKADLTEIKRLLQSLVGNQNGNNI